MTKSVAVIGGGITGLSAAYQLIQDGHSVVLFEASDRLGGKIGEVSIDGTTIPTGPDAFLARRPEVTELAEEVGLGDALISPIARAARIFRNGQLHPLPPNVLGVPATLDLTATGLISAQGAAIAAAGVDDIGETVSDESVGSLVRRQLGDEVLEFLVDPLLGGINAGDSDRLSLAAGVPQLNALNVRPGRLVDAAAATIADAAKKIDPATPPAPVFHAIEGGLGRLIDRLREILEVSSNFELRTNERPTLERAGEQWRVGGADSESSLFDEVISTIPAHGTAGLISDVSRDAADLLSSIEYSSVALTLMILAPGTIDLDQGISGVLVPRSLGHHVTAVSFASHKWPQLASTGGTASGRQVLRVSVGRRTDSRWLELDDDELVAAIEDDLSEIFDSEVRATHTVVTRWTKALPQYDVGHLDKIAAIDALLVALPGLQLTGAWRNGLGLPACVAAGRDAGRLLPKNVL